MNDFGTTLIPIVNLVSGGSKRNNMGRNLSLATQNVIPAVTTYFYRILATGIRGTTTTLSAVPIGAVIEGVSTI